MWCIDEYELNINTLVTFFAKFAKNRHYRITATVVRNTKMTKEI